MRDAACARARAYLPVDCRRANIVSKPISRRQTNSRHTLKNPDRVYLQSTRAMNVYPLSPDIKINRIAENEIEGCEAFRCSGTENHRYVPCSRHISPFHRITSSPDGISRYCHRFNLFALRIRRRSVFTKSAIRRSFRCERERETGGLLERLRPSNDLC